MRIQKYLLWLLVLLLALDLPAQLTAASAENIRLIAVHPSDPDAFTQGLECDEEGRLFLATGLHGASRIGILNLSSGAYEALVHLDKTYFGEGITFAKNGLWQLTWQEHVAFLRDKQSLEVKKSVPHENEGWGIAYWKDKDVLLVSDGSARICLRDAESFALLDSFTLESPMLNELEYADGYLYANIWLSSKILKIDLSQRKTVAVYDFSELLASLELSPQARARMDVLNGIAHIENQRFYVTGKHYPVVLEVELE